MPGKAKQIKFRYGRDTLSNVLFDYSPQQEGFVDHVMMTNQLLALYKANKHWELTTSIKKLKRGQFAQQCWLNQIFNQLFEQFINTQDKSEKDQILGLARFIKDEIDPEFQVDGPGSPTLFFRVCSSACVEFATILLKESRKKANVNFTVLKPGLKINPVAISIISNNPIADQLKILELLLEFKPEVFPETMAVLVQDDNYLLILIRLLSHGVEILHPADNLELNLLMEAFRSFLPEHNENKGLIDPKAVAEKEKAKQLKRLQDEPKVKAVLNCLLEEMNKRQQAFAKETPPNVEKMALVQKIKDIALVYAVATGSKVVVDTLLQAGADPLFINPEPKNGALQCTNVLVSAVLMGHLRICLDVLRIIKTKESKENAERIQIIKNHALSIAIGTCQPHMVKLLLDEGADPNYYDDDIQTALQNVIAAFFYLEEGSLSDKYTEGEQKQVKEVDTLPPKPKADPKTDTDPGESESDTKRYRYFNLKNLSNSELFQRATSIFNYLLDKKYKTNVDLLGNSILPPLVMLIWIKRKELVLKLLDAGADATVRTDLGSTVFHEAMTTQQLDLVPALRAKTPPDTLFVLNQDGQSALGFLIERFSPETVKQYYTELKLDINATVMEGAHNKERVSSLAVAVSTGQLPMVRVMLELGSDVTQVFTNREGTIHTTVFYYGATKEIFTLLMATWLRKVLKVDHNPNTDFDAITHLAAFFAQFHPVINHHGALELSLDRLPFDFINQLRRRTSIDLIVLPQKEIICLVRELEKDRTLDLLGSLRVSIEHSELYHKFQLEVGNQPYFEQAKTMISQASALYQDALKKGEQTTGVLDLAYGKLDEINEVLETIEVLPTHDKERVSGKKAQIASLKENLDAASKALDKIHQENLKLYQDNQGLLTEISMVIKASDLDLDKFQKAEKVIEGLRRNLKDMEALGSNIAALSEQIQNQLPQVTELKVKYVRHDQSVGLQKQQQQARAKREQKLLSERQKQNAQELKEQSERQTKLEQTISLKQAVWRKEQEALRQSREALAARIKAAQKEAEEMAQKQKTLGAGGSCQPGKPLLTDFVKSMGGFKSQSKQGTKPGLKTATDPKTTTGLNTVTVKEHLPLMLQEGVGVELEQLAAAVKVLKDHVMQYDKLEAEKNIVEIEFKRRTLLGLMARIMEHFVQRKLSPGLDVNIAKHFRDVIYHGNFFPDVAKGDLAGAIRVNDSILEMAEKLLAFLRNKAKLNVQDWKEVNKAIGCPLFEEIINRHVKEISDKEFYLDGIRKERLVLARLEQYEREGGIFVHVDEAAIILDNAFGFTYGILGAHAARLKQYSPADYEAHKREYDEYIAKGKDYRHVRQAQVRSTSLVSVNT